MTEGEYLVIAIIGGLFLAMFLIAGIIGVWVVRHRKERKHQEVFFATIEEKRERRKKSFKENMGRRYGS
jgi:hypothetical protein